MPLLCVIGLPFVNIGKVITMAKKRSDRERSPFGARMFLARKCAGMTQMAVREALGVSQGTLSELEGTAASSGRIVDFARLYEVDAGWLASGNGFPPAQREPVPGTGEQIPGFRYEAHLPSDQKAILPPQRDNELVAWRDLEMADLRGTFCVQAQDDSMAPVIKRGATLDFDGRLEPRTDDVVLLKDAGGVWYVRTYQQGPRKRWGARAENAAFLSMDSERDDLHVIAVLTAVRGRRG